MKIKLFFLNKIIAMLSPPPLSRGLPTNLNIVIPAQAGIQNGVSLRESGVAVKRATAPLLPQGYAFPWIPACAGMTSQKLWVTFSPLGEGAQSKSSILSILFYSILILFLTSCASPPTRINYYDFGSLTSSTDSKTSCTLPPIYLSDIKVPSTLKSDAMHYRLLYVNDLQTRVYANSRWSMTPAELLAQRIKSQLAPGGVTFVDNGISISNASETVMQLRLQLDDFAQYFSDPNHNYSQLKVNATLLRGRTFIAQTTIEQRVHADAPDAIAGVRAMRVASDQMIADLGNWLCGTQMTEGG